MKAKKHSAVVECTKHTEFQSSHRLSSRSLCSPGEVSPNNQCVVERLARAGS